MKDKIKISDSAKLTTIKKDGKKITKKVKEKK